MLRTIAKLYAYRKAPATTFVALHPIKTLKLLGSGIVALPLGIWLGARMSRASRGPGR